MQPLFFRLRPLSGFRADSVQGGVRGRSGFSGGRLRSACAGLLWALLLGAGLPAFADYHVSTSGLDTNPGTLEQPFRTLEAARNAIRTLKAGPGLPPGGLSVFLHAGTYSLTASFSLTSQDGGAADKPITYRAYNGEAVRLIGGVEIPAAWFSAVTSGDAVWGRLASAAQGSLLKADLKAHGLNDYGTLQPRGYVTNLSAAMEIFFGGEAMTLARWPNTGFSTVASAPLGAAGMAFTYAGTQPERWTQAPEVWFMGYWYNLYAENYVKMTALDTAAKRITVATNPAYGILAGQPYFAQNLLEELDTAGEYYIDRVNGLLYFWPTGDIAGGQTLASTLSAEMLKADLLSHVTLQDLTFEVCRGPGISLTNCTNVLVKGCTIRNTGTDAVTISGGSGCGVEDSLIYNTGDHGVILNGGTRSTLTPCNHFVRNSEIHHFSRWDRTGRPAVRAYGVGCTISHNLIHDGPHVALRFSGNDHVIEYNEIHHVVGETADAGAVYTGRDWGSRGNLIRYNFLHDIDSVNRKNSWDVVAFYNDDCDSGDRYYGNILYKIPGIGFLIGGGRDNTFDNNILKDVTWCFFADQRGLAKIVYDTGATYDTSWDLLAKIAQYNYTASPWAAKYPSLATIQSEGRTEAMRPKGNSISRCIAYGTSAWTKEGTWGEAGALAYFTFTDNKTNNNPLFVNEAALDMNLQAASPALTIPGFQVIPFDEIGIVADSAPRAPAITSQPQSATVADGAAASLQVVATGDAPLAYQWKKDGANISGAAAASYAIAAAVPSDAGNYTCTVTNGVGSVVSDAAVVTVSATAPPSITAQPAALTLDPGAAASFSVTASGTAPLTYQWKKDGAVLPGATGSSYSIVSVQQSHEGAYHCTVTNLMGSVSSSAAALAVNDPPAITQQPASLTVNVGAAATMTVAASGTAPLAYQWSKDGAAIAGATAAILQSSSVQLAHAGSYTCTVSNGAGSVVSNAAVLTVGVAVAPAITAQPAALAVNPGAAASFSVTASGTAPLAYQWKKNSVNLTGANSASYTIAAAAQSDEGSFTCSVSNSAGSAVSNAAALTVNDPPAITAQPAALTVNPGAAAAFAVTASGTAPLSYQWKKNGTSLSGATAASYSIVAVAQSDEGSFTCSVSNSAGSAVSSAATLTVNDPPAVTAQPVALTVNPGAAASFSVTASGTAPLAYQWKKNGTNIAGATSAAYSITSAQQSNEGAYACTVTNAQGSAVSNAAPLTVNDPPAITAQPAVLTVNPGATANFSVTASGTAPLAYQWKKNGVNIPGATGASCSISAAAQADEGSFTCAVTNAAGSVVSNAAALTVNDPPAVTTPPASQTVDPGTAVALSIAATGTAPLNYQWKKDGAALAGAVNATYAIASAQASHQGAYSCVVGNSAGSVESAAANLVVNTAPSITAQPVAQTVNPGSAASFSVTAAGSAPLSYQWKKDGAAIPGATASSYALASVQASNAGSYACTVTNAAGSAVSAAAVLTVNAAPAVTAQPASLTVNPGAGASFTVAASGTAPLSYQWKKDGAVLGGATGATYSIASAQQSSAGNYACTVTNALGSAVSAAATLSVRVPPAITAQPADRSVLAGAGASFTVAASGTAPLAYQWKKNGANVSGATAASYSIAAAQPADAASYACNVSNAAGSAESSAAVLTVTQAPSITAQPAGQTVNPGSAVSFSVAASGTAPLAYQWKINASAIAGATGTGYSIASVQAAQAGSYTCTVSNAVGSVESAAAVLAVNAPPSVTTHPASAAVNPGAAASFSVTASGTPPLSYQWTRNGANLAGSTAASLAIASAAETDEGAYACVVGNMAGSAVSAAGNLSVNDPPVVTDHPQSQSVAPGASVSLSVAASGTPPLSYQWKKGGGAVAGATAAIYAIVAAQAADEGSYSCLVSNSAGSAESAAASVTVRNAPVIVEDPQSLTVAPASPASMSVTASGSPPLAYQWKKNGTALAGAAAATLSTAAAAASDAGSYSCLVTNAYGAAESAAATLVVHDAPHVATQPVAQTVAPGAPASFTVGASATTPLTYQWRKDGAALAGATGATYSIAAAQQSHEGAYSCRISNSFGTVDSEAAILAVYDPPAVTAQPTGRTVNPGESFTLSVTASGSPALSYQWKKNGTALAGAQAASYSINLASEADEGSYACAVTNPYGSALSDAAGVTVLDPPTLSAQPQPRTVSPGASASFSVTAAGAAPLSYQWKKDGVALSGKTAATLALTAVQDADAGNYRCAVSNSAGMVESASAALSVLDAPVITLQPQGASVGVGEAVTLTVAAAGDSPLSYQWKRNNADVAGAANAVLSLPSVQETDEGSYACQVSNAVGSAVSNAATLQVNQRPVVLTQPQAKTVLAGAPAAFAVSASGAPPLAYQWKKDGANLSGATAANWSVAAAAVADAGSYSCTISNAYGSVASTAAALTVNAGPTIRTQPANLTAAPGGPANFSVLADGTAPLAYQWKKNGANIAGATGAVYSIAACAAGDAGSYACRVTNAYGSADSAAAVLGLYAAPAITLQPTARSVAPGAQAAFSVTATGTGPLQYQWRRNGTNIAGAVAATCSIAFAAQTDEGAYSCRVSNDYGAVISADAALAVYDPPTVATPPTGRTVDPGESASFSVAATGTAPLGYQWKKNGTPISGATQAAYTVSAAAQADQGAYSCRVSNAYGADESASAELLVNDPPTFTGQPASVTVDAGGAASFRATVTGATPLSYQWKKNGVPVTGAVGAVLALDPVVQSDAGSYACTASNSAGAAESAPAVLTVTIPDPLKPPVLTVQPPASSTVLAGETVLLSVTASGTGAMQYQWRKDGSDLSDGGRLLGTRTNALSIASAMPVDSGSYRCAVTNANGPTESSACALTIDNPPPTITQQPVAQSAEAGAAVAFTVAAAGGGPLEYQWTKDGVALAAGGRVVGVRTTTLSISASLPADAGAYACTVTNSAGTVATADAALTISSPPPSVTRPPASQTVLAGETFQLSVETSGAEPMDMQWEKDGTALANGGSVLGARDRILQISNSTVADAGAYLCVLTNAAGTVRSPAATVAISNPPPTVTLQPADLTLEPGADAYFTLGALGGGPLSYQWNRNGQPMENAGRVIGARTDRLSISAVEETDEAAYSCTITNTAARTDSAAGQLTVTIAPAILSQPRSLSVDFGQPAQFSIVVSGECTYQWQKDGADLENGARIIGAQTSRLTINDVGPADGGEYRCQVENPLRPLFSDPAALTVLGGDPEPEQTRVGGWNLYD